MNYKETVMDNGVRRKLSILERIDLLEQDVDDLYSPDTLPNGHQIAALIHRAQIIGNNIRRCKRDMTEQLNSWVVLRDRIQRAVGSSDALAYSDTGNKRNSLRHLVSATWGPINFKNVAEGTGIKQGLLKIEEDSAMQLASYFADANGAVQKVAYSYDDFVSIGEQNLARIASLERDLEVRHYDFNNLVKLVEVEAFESRKTQLPTNG